MLLLSYLMRTLNEQRVSVTLGSKETTDCFCWMTGLPSSADVAVGSMAHMEFFARILTDLIFEDYKTVTPLIAAILLKAHRKVSSLRLKTEVRSPEGLAQNCDPL